MEQIAPQVRAGYTQRQENPGTIAFCKDGPVDIATIRP